MGRFSLTILTLWFFSHVAVSSGDFSPDMTLVSHNHELTESALLRSLHAILLELQLIEITIKNRRHAPTEARATDVITRAKAEGEMLAKRLRSLRREQISLFDNLADYTQIPHISSLRFGSEELTLFGNIPRHTTLLKTRIAEANRIYSSATAEVKRFQADTFTDLHDAFSDTRFGLFSRLDSSRRALGRLAQMNTSMSAPEESGALYNQILDHLYSYGVDISLDQTRGVSVQGFLLAPSPEEARRRYEQLKFRPSEQTYNSPSG